MCQRCGHAGFRHRPGCGHVDVAARSRCECAGLVHPPPPAPPPTPPIPAPAAVAHRDDAGAIVLVLPFTAPPVTANEARNGTKGWRQQAAAKREVAAAVMAALVERRVQPMARVRFTLTWYAPDRGTRDPDGLFPMLKACIDACTPPRDPIPLSEPTKAGRERKRAHPGKAGVGIIADDHAGHVASCTTAIVLADPHPRIEFRIDPA